MDSLSRSVQKPLLTSRNLLDKLDYPVLDGECILGGKIPNFLSRNCFKGNLIRGCETISRVFNYRGIDIYPYSYLRVDFSEIPESACFFPPFIDEFTYQLLRVRGFDKRFATQFVEQGFCSDWGDNQIAVSDQVSRFANSTVLSIILDGMVSYVNDVLVFDELY